VSWPNRILFVLMIVGGLVLLPHREGVEPDDLARITAERDELREKVARIRTEIGRLQGEVDALHHDPDDPLRSEARVQRELARIAREDLNLIRPGEVVFEVVHEGGRDR
jgi:cell division protein FtsB